MGPSWPPASGPSSSAGASILHPRYLSTWLRDRGSTPQEPRRIPRERDPKAIAARLESDWPRIKTRHGDWGARIAPIDEIGLMMGPLLRRTRSPKGRTPAITQRGARRQKVSVAAAVRLPPRRGHPGPYFHARADGYFDSWYATAFIEAMPRDLPGHSAVVRDGGPMHEGEPIHAPGARFADRLISEMLPPWVPMLNPAEPLWSWSTWERLSNFAPHDVGELDERVIAELASRRGNQEFLRNLSHASELPFPRILLP